MATVWLLLLLVASLHSVKGQSDEGVCDEDGILGLLEADMETAKENDLKFYELLERCQSVLGNLYRF